MEENPAFGMVRLGYDTTQPQLFIEVDRARASDLGVASTGWARRCRRCWMAARWARVHRDRSFDIQMISTADPVNDPSDLERIFVRTAAGQNVPISSFVRLEERAVAPELGREAQMRSVPITAGLTPGAVAGQALAEVQAYGRRNPAPRQPRRAAGRGGNAGRNQRRALADLWLCHPDGVSGAGGAVRKLCVGGDRDVHRAAGAWPAPSLRCC
jgi:multidrug efflux pump subunit AcrB